MKSSVLVVGLSAALLLATGAVAQDKIQIGDKMVFPESITTTSDGTLYAGSFAQGVVFKAAPGATATSPFIGPQTEGPTSVIGVWADEKAGLLWACYSDPAFFSGQPGKPAIARTYALSDGALKGTYPLPEGSFCNDFEATADGTVLVVDTFGSRILQLKPGGTALEPWFADAALQGVDGISVAADGAVYVNNVFNGKLFKIADGALTEIATSAPLMGPDGHRFGPDGKLYVAENGAGRVSALTIAGDKAEVALVKDGYDMPTAVAIVGNTLYVNESKFSKMGAADDPGLFYAYLVPLN
jgi:DNA-binding beta-propeller fold protein YncE